MADVTVEQLAAVVGAPVERLLQQMKDAGLSKAAAKNLCPMQKNSSYWLT